MPLYNVTRAATLAWTGADAATGLVDFGMQVGQDTQRALVMSMGFVNDDNVAVPVANVRLVLAPSLAAASTGPFFEIVNVDSEMGFTKAGCGLVVPNGWNLYILTTPTGTETNPSHAIVDWRRVENGGRY